MDWLDMCESPLEISCDLLERLLRVTSDKLSCRNDIVIAKCSETAQLRLFQLNSPGHQLIVNLKVRDKRAAGGTEKFFGYELLVIRDGGHGDAFLVVMRSSHGDARRAVDSWPARVAQIWEHVCKGTVVLLAL